MTVPESPPDSELVARCLGNDQNAWNALVDRYAPLVYGIARRHRLDDDEAADVFQQVFLIVYRELHSLKSHEALAGWLITITRRECLRLLRFSPPATELDEDVVDELAYEQIERNRWEERQAVARAMQELDPRCRELLTALFLIEPPLTYAQLSAKLSIPPGSIGPTRARCFEKLQSILKKYGFDGAR
ncbi:MAG: sigma-70 family RNA polymerase sigma factor [Chloroflexi bacterium]|nr:sigma-70 family RNA polymerase sigma factor [Chloroflexota bacterium]